MTTTSYRIVVDGEIDAACAAAFEPAVVTTSAGRTTDGPRPIDQSALHGVLERVAALGLRLVSVDGDR